MQVSKWPYLSEVEVELGNLDADIGVCTLWSPRKEFITRHLMGVLHEVAVVGNLYSARGAGIMIRNFLANPKLRYLVVSGTELGMSKTALVNLDRMDAGLLEKACLTEDMVRRFFDQTKVVFTDTAQVADMIATGAFRDAERERKKFEAMEVPLPEPSATVFPAPMAGHLVRARTIAEGYQLLLGEIRRFGHITGRDSEGHRRQELWQLKVVIGDQRPDAFDTIPHPEYGVEQIKKYCEDFWLGTEPADLAYRYGHIIRHGFGDQVEAVVEAFGKKAETFRTVISLWDPRTEDGSIVAEDPPCITTIHPRIIGGKLYMSAYIRTNDMYSGWPLNAAALRYFQWQLMKRVREELGNSAIELGDLDVNSGSAHFYERDWREIDITLAEAPRIRFTPDPKGNFEVKVEGGFIIVNHYDPDGGLVQVFKGTDAEKLSHQIAPFVSMMLNGLYIGRALMAAQVKLENG